MAGKLYPAGVIAVLTASLLLMGCSTTAATPDRRESDAGTRELVRQLATRLTFDASSDGPVESDRDASQRLEQIHEALLLLDDEVAAADLQPLRALRQEIVSSPAFESWDHDNLLDAIDVAHSPSVDVDRTAFAMIADRAEQSLRDREAERQRGDDWLRLGETWQRLGRLDRARMAFLAAGNAYLAERWSRRSDHYEVAWALFGIDEDVEASAYLFRALSTNWDDWPDELTDDAADLAMLAWAASPETDKVDFWWDGRTPLFVLDAYMRAAEHWHAVNKAEHRDFALDQLELAIDSWEARPPATISCGSAFYRRFMIDIARQTGDTDRLRSAFDGLPEAFAANDRAWDEWYANEPETLTLIHCRRRHDSPGWDHAAQIILESRMPLAQFEAGEAPSQRIDSLLAHPNRLFRTCSWSGHRWPCARYANAVYSSIDRNALIAAINDLANSITDTDLMYLPVSSLLLWALGAEAAGDMDGNRAAMELAATALPHHVDPELVYPAFILANQPAPR